MLRLVIMQIRHARNGIDKAHKKRIDMVSDLTFPKHMQPPGQVSQRPDFQKTTYREEDVRLVADNSKLAKREIPRKLSLVRDRRLRNRHIQEEVIHYVMLCKICAIVRYLTKEARCYRASAGVSLGI
jgi:hypothetical protein